MKVSEILTKTNIYTCVEVVHINKRILFWDFLFRIKQSRNAEKIYESEVLNVQIVEKSLVLLVC